MFKALTVIVITGVVAAVGLVSGIVVGVQSSGVWLKELRELDKKFAGASSEEEKACIDKERHALKMQLLELGLLA